MSTLNAVKPSAVNVDAKIAKVKALFADRRKKLVAARDAKKVNQAQYEELLSTLQNKETRAIYQVKRNARPDVREKRTAYNRKRYNDGKAATKRLKDLGIA